MAHFHAMTLTALNLERITVIAQLFFQKCFIQIWRNRIFADLIKTIKSNASLKETLETWGATSVKKLLTWGINFIFFIMTWNMGFLYDNSSDFFMTKSKDQIELSKIFTHVLEGNFLESLKIWKLVTHWNFN